MENKTEFKVFFDNSLEKIKIRIIKNRTPILIVIAILSLVIVGRCKIDENKLSNSCSSI